MNRHLNWKRRAALTILCLISTLPGCRSPYYADRGAVMGGLTGAGVGAAIGNANGNTGAGAVVGSAFGALTGALVGNEMDIMQAENQAMIDQRLAERSAGAATMGDVVSMTRAGLSDDVISNHIRTRGVASPPSTTDLIALKDAGVSDHVIRSMQEMGAVPPPLPARPVIVEDRYIAHPAPYYGPHFGYHGWHGPRYAYRHRPGVRWGVSLGH
jgi:hypothetical protein